MALVKAGVIAAPRHDFQDRLRNNISEVAKQVANEILQVRRCRSLRQERR